MSTMCQVLDRNVFSNSPTARGTFTTGSALDNAAMAQSFVSTLKAE